MAPLNEPDPAATGTCSPDQAGTAARRRVRDLAGLALLAAFLAASFRDALRLPFLNDDYIFLDRTRSASWTELFGMRQLMFHWWRPWSRELHYRTLQQLVGANEPAFHAANFLLWLGVIAVFAALVRRTAGAAASAWAAAAAAALAAWGLPLLWVAGVQDLWMLLWVLLAITAWCADRRWLATGAFALALLSKETAVVLPGIVLAWDLLVARRPLRAALTRVAPIAAIALAWAAIHPPLGGRPWHAAVLEGAPEGLGLPPWVAFVRSLLVVANLDAWPRPAVSVLALVRVALLPVALLVALAWVRWPERREAAPRGLFAFGASWALLGWLPLLLPGLGWHAYYALLGALGLLLALAPLAARSRTVAMAALVLLGGLGVARALTPSLDWGEATYQRRAGALCGSLRAMLMRRHPAFAAHSRLYFQGVPDRIGFLSGDGPALRVWYGEPTLTAGYFSAYRPRVEGDFDGRDYFFRLDTLTGWVEIDRGPEDADRARALNPAWELDQALLAGVMARAGDWPSAARCFEKLARAYPDNPEYAFHVAVCLAQTDDSAAAGWLARAARLPGASAEIREAAAAAGVLGR